MTEDQILQRVAESQKRVFSDIDSSKQQLVSVGMQIVGGNGIAVQQQKGQAAISFSEEGGGGNGEQGEQGEQGEAGPAGPAGASVSSVSVSGNLSFTFTLTDGTTIVTPPLLTGDGLMYFAGSSISTIPSAGDLSVLGSGGGGTPYWIGTEACN